MKSWIVSMGIKAVTLMAVLVAIVSAHGQGRIYTSSGVAFGGIVMQNLNGSNPLFLTQDLWGHKDSMVTVSRDNRRMSFLRTTPQGTFVFVANTDGTDARQLTFPSGLSGSDRDSNPAISPDGNRVAFVSNRRSENHPWGGEWRPMEVYIVNSDGTDLRRITTAAANSGSGPWGEEYATLAWDPNGGALAMVAWLDTMTNGYQWCAAKIGTSGGDSEVILSILWDGNCGAIDWSPDGRYIAAPHGRYQQLMLFDHNSNVAYEKDTSYIGGMSSGAGQVRFSPDSQTLLYSKSGGWGPWLFRIGATNLECSNAWDTGAGVMYDGFWAGGGPEIPTPASIVFNPNPVRLRVGAAPLPIDVRVLDAQGNVITRSFQSCELDGYQGIISMDLYGNMSATGIPNFGPCQVRFNQPGISSNWGYVLVNDPVIKTSLVSVVRDGGQFVVRVKFENIGDGNASWLRVTSAKLGQNAPTETVPFWIANPGWYGGPFMPGTSQEVELHFPASPVRIGNRSTSLALSFDWILGQGQSTLLVPLP